MLTKKVKPVPCPFGEEPWTVPVAALMPKNYSPHGDPTDNRLTVVCEDTGEEFRALRGSKLGQCLLYRRGLLGGGRAHELAYAKATRLAKMMNERYLRTGEKTIVIRATRERDERMGLSIIELFRNAMNSGSGSKCLHDRLQHGELIEFSGRRFLNKRTIVVGRDHIEITSRISALPFPDNPEDEVLAELLDNLVQTNSIDKYI